MSILGEFDVAAYGDFTVCVFIINAGTQNFRSTQHPEGLAERSEASVYLYPTASLDIGASSPCLSI